MKNKQDIGSALKSKFEDLHDSPDDFVWNAIGEILKKKKRRLLFWYFTFFLVVLALSLFIFNPFKSFYKSDINGLKLQEQKLEIVEQENDLNSSSNTNIEHKNSKQHTNDTLHTDYELSKDGDTSTKSSPIKENTLTTSTIASKNPNRTSMSSENQKLDNTQPNQKNSEIISQTSSLATTNTKDSKSSNSEDKTDLKLSQSTTKAREKSGLVESSKERVEDSLSNIETEVIAISEEEKDDEKELLLEDEKVKDSITKKLVRWSINPQLIQSNYGTFSAKTSDNTSTNYGLLLGVRMTESSFLRFGVRQLDLKQTINEVTHTVNYWEIPLELKYLFRNKKFNPYLTGGISYFFLEDNSSGNPMNLEYGDNFSLNLGLGIEHKLFDRLYINLESNFNYQVNPININTDYTPYIFSISTGVDYRF